METHITIFLSLIAFTMVMSVIGIWKRIPLMLFIGGAIITFWAIMTDSIIINDMLISDVGQTKMIIETSQTLMQENGGTTASVLRSGSQIFQGEKILITSELYAKPINQVQIHMNKVGSPTGTATIGVWNTLTSTPSATNYLYRIGSIDVSTLNTVRQSHQFTNRTETFILGDSQAVGIFYNGGSAGNELNVYVTASNAFDTTNSFRTRYTTFWTDDTTIDLRMSIRNTGIEETIIDSGENDFQNNIIPFEMYPKILFAIVGSVLMIGGALMWKFEES